MTPARRAARSGLPPAPSADVGVAQIAAGPAGPRVAAIFDFDGTLIRGYSILAFLGAQLRHGQIGIADLGRAARSLFESLASGGDQREILTRGIAQWRGQEVAALQKLGQQLYDQELEASVFPAMRALIAAHRQQGHTLLIASSATSFQVEPAARALDIARVLCTRLEHVGGRLTGGIVGPLLWGAAKATAVQQFAAQQDVDLARSYFYADGDEDEALMHLVGAPRPVNPRPQLERVATRRGWPVQRFTLGGGRS